MKMKFVINGNNMEAGKDGIGVATPTRKSSSIIVGVIRQLCSSK